MTAVKTTLTEHKQTDNIYSLVLPCSNHRPTKKQPWFDQIKPEHWKAWIDSIIDQRRDRRARVQL